MYDITFENSPERIPMMKKNLQYFADLDGDNYLFNFLGSSSLWSALAVGDKALRWLNRSLEILPRFGVSLGPGRISTLAANTFYSERENPISELRILSSRSVLNMLIQSWGNKICGFSACLSTWKDTQFFNLRAEGTFLVNVVREICQTQFVQFQRLAVEPCVLKTDFVGDVKLMGSENMTMHEQNDFIELNSGKGETAILYVGEKPNVFKGSDLPITKNEKNSWGVKNSSSFKELHYEINKIILTVIFFNKTGQPYFRWVNEKAKLYTFDFLKIGQS